MTVALTAVQAYHERSKHRLQRYAAGPETLDWDAQPDPFRRWHGAPLTPLPLAADRLEARWVDLKAGVAAQPVSLESIGTLFELSFALTAWKQLGPDRWALRANPSSGNLHPTEAYAWLLDVPGLDSGLYHYAPREHALELRCAWPGDATPGTPRLWLGLSSIQWREAWKYGERAFRYCQLDVGHALGALRYAAAALGWTARVAPDVGHADLAALLGLDRHADFAGAEREEPELLVQVGPAGSPDGRPAPPLPDAPWFGGASRLDAHPMYRWPVIDEVAQATQSDAGCATDAAPASAPACTESAARGTLLAATLIRSRRSAQRFDRAASLPVAAFFRIAAALLPDAGLPWDTWPHRPRVHAVLYLHRVSGIAPGAYVLARSVGGAALLGELLHTGQIWHTPTERPSGLPLQRIAEHPGLAASLRTLSCHQAIASDACFAVSLLAEYDDVIAGEPWRYRQLLREAGLIGHVLYLQAEAEGYRGTGIGCYFDDDVHQLLGLSGRRLQVLYHFTVGAGLADSRLSTEPPYADRPSVVQGQ
jgi:SagB-type dehydrogenase family enzyme